MQSDNYTIKNVFCIFGIMPVICTSVVATIQALDE